MLFIFLSHKKQIIKANLTECPDKIFEVTDKWKDGFRGSVCFKPPADYTNPEPWNVTIQVAAA
jgi:hypothetical protein